jgi:hypothetical protein
MLRTKLISPCRKYIADLGYDTPRAVSKLADQVSTFPSGRHRFANTVYRSSSFNAIEGLPNITLYVVEVMRTARYRFNAIS